MWQIIVPIAAVIVLGYTLYRNVWPYPTGDQHWFPIVAGIWLAVAIVAVIAAPRTARRLGQALTAEDIGGALPEPMTAPGLAVAGEETSAG